MKKEIKEKIIKELSLRAELRKIIYSCELDQPMDEDIEEMLNKIIKFLVNRIKKEKFQHAHKTIDEEYNCGCAWRSDVIDEIIDDLKFKKNFIKVKISTPPTKHKHKWVYFWDSSPSYEECKICGKRENNY